MFSRTGVLKNLAIFTRKYLSLFSITTGQKACIFIKEDTPTQVFSHEYFKTYKNSFFYDPKRKVGEKTQMMRMI